ncbi:hypothetical protein L0U88_02870 [Flavihumibacter sp. RY-1]|uniref:ZU5 domain-containing protein n=1 Tax=Flavihumibacter fluminis TaxID=2909236 RepID=A0ABS9BD07_9BACT|nr:hypothetical protein [Flavihumibacter fluminis]MCF1713571.1 hypothetical protein [Flavihumibacter fluminis]
MKTRSRLFYLLINSALLLLFSYASCNRENEGPGAIMPTPEIRPRGTALGNPVSSTIPASGGELKSADGKLLLKLPAGAVSAGTVISIQPIENTLPGGRLTAYRLLPEELSLGKPIELIYTYSEEDVAGTAEDALFLAYQKNDGVWSFMTETSLDAANRKLTVTTNRFSDWAPFALFRLTADPDEVKAGAESKLSIKIADTYLLAPEHKERAIGKSRPLNDKNKLSNWMLTGQGELSVKEDKSGATFKAPVQVNGAANVTISVDLNRVVPEDTLPRIRLSQQLQIYKRVRFYQETYFIATAGNDEINFPAHYFVHQDGILSVVGAHKTSSGTPSISLMMGVGAELKSRVYPWNQDLKDGTGVMGYVLTLTDGYISTHACDDVASPGAVAAEVIEEDGVTFIQGEFNGRVYRNRDCDDDFSLPIRGVFRVKAR